MHEYRVQEYEMYNMISGVKFHNVEIISQASDHSGDKY